MLIMLLYIALYLAPVGGVFLYMPHGIDLCERCHGCVPVAFDGSV
jgi:hypothetical protein